MSWLGDRLTLTHGRSLGRPQSTVVRTASARTQSVRAPMRPLEFGDRDEVEGRDQPAVAQPADEGLVADRRAGAQVDDRLEVEAQLAARDRDGQPGPELELVHRCLVHRRLEHLEAALAPALGQVHRDVGVADEVVGRPVVGAGDGYADAGPHGEAVPAAVERLAEHPKDPLGDACRDRGIAVVRERDDELVAAEPGRRVAVADGAPQALADRHQQGVAGVVAVAVVDRLEVVDVEKEDRQLPLRGAVGIGRGQAFGEEAAVRQRGQRIEEGLAPEQLHERLALGQAVAKLAHRVGEPGDDEDPDDRPADAGTAPGRPGGRSRPRSRAWPG